MKKLATISAVLLASLSVSGCFGTDYSAGPGYGYGYNDIGYRYSVPPNQTGRYYYAGPVFKKDFRGAGYERPFKGCLGWQRHC